MKTGLLLLVMLAPLVCAADLALGFYSAPAVFFTKEEAQKMPENGQADIAAVLKARGYEMPEGSSAYFDAAAAQIFLRSSQSDVNRLRVQLRGVQADIAAVTGVKQVRVTAVCYAIPLSAVPADFGPASPLQSLPQDKLSVVDRATLLCRGGQRAKVESRGDKAEKAADSGDEAPPVGAEREFDIEATVGEDGTTIDLNLVWSLRTPAFAPPGQRGEFKISTQVLGTHGGSVMQELGVTAEAEPRLVLLTLQLQIEPSPLPHK